jgi:hypothetical protein
LSKNIYTLSGASRDIILLNDLSSFKKQELILLEAVENFYKTRNDLIEWYSFGVKSEAGIENILNDKGTVFLEINKMLDLARRNSDAEATKILLNSINPIMLNWQFSIDKYITGQHKYIQKLFVKVSIISSNFRQYLVVLAVLICPLLMVVLNLIAIKYFKTKFANER